MERVEMARNTVIVVGGFATVVLALYSALNAGKNPVELNNNALGLDSNSAQNSPDSATQTPASQDNGRVYYPHTGIYYNPVQDPDNMGRQCLRVDDYQINTETIYGASFAVGSNESTFGDVPSVTIYYKDANGNPIGDPVTVTQSPTVGGRGIVCANQN